MYYIYRLSLEMGFTNSTAYPFWNGPHAGKCNELPDFYKQYQDELNRKKEEQEQQWKEERDRRWGNYDPFGDYGPRSHPFDFEEEQEAYDPNYPYSVFGMKRSASQEDMKKAYREAVRATHPDKTGGETEDEFREVQEAYEYYRTHL